MRQKPIHLKPEIRILGVDDGPFDPDHTGEVPLVGVVMRGGRWVDGIMRTSVMKDGTDSTERLIGMVLGSRHFEQLRVIMTEGITFAGFNVMDVSEVHVKTGLPVVVLSRELPSMRDIRKAIANVPGWRERWELIKNAGRIHPVDLKGGRVYVQATGMRLEDAVRLVRLSSTRSIMPEPLRIAHLIATAIVRGESYGRV
ncbi:MAG: DUF99 family protein [Candidatus Hadarchaeales archaeon]